MNRRGFLKTLGIGTAAVACAGSIGMSRFDWIDTGESAGFAEPVTISAYADYINFSEFALKTSMDETVQKVAEELGHLHGLRINHLIKGGFPEPIN